ncbi:MAG: uncharacterized protein QOI76_1050 [Frankiales bacterium]|nr:uncharacterized protein [Frankiales bacterium]
MATLAETLHDDMIAALRARDELVTGTLRMALTALKTEAVAGKAARTLTDEEELAVVSKEAKKRREAAEMFTAGGRDELAARELAEAAVLDRYLPAALTDEELTQLVAEAIAETGAEGPRGLGLVMKAISAQTAGRADGKRVSAEVRRQLG